jgi:O-antigen ligase
MTETRAEYVIRIHHLWWLVLIFACIAAGAASLFVNPIFIIAELVLIANVFLIIKFPIWGLLSYLIIFLLRPGEMVPALSALRPELLTGLLVIITIIFHQRFKLGKVIFPRDRVTLFLLAFLIVMAISIFISYEKSNTVDSIMDFVKLLIFYYLIVSIIDTRKKLVAFIIVYLVLIAYIAFDAFQMYMEGGFVHTMGVDRMRGSTSAGGDPNSLANTLAATIPFVVASGFYFRNILAKVILFALAIGMAALITVTASRGGLVAFLGVVIGGIAFSRHKLVLVVACIMFLLIGWTLLPDQYKERYQTMTELDNIDETSSGRWSIWSNGVNMIINRPILGVGAGAFRWACASGDFGPPQWMQAHNLYIQLFASTGIIGFLVWFGFIFQFNKKLWDLMRAVRYEEKYRWLRFFAVSFVITTIALLISGMFAHSLYRYTWYMMAALTTVMARMVAPLTENSNRPSSDLTESGAAEAGKA